MTSNRHTEYKVRQVERLHMADIEKQMILSNILAADTLPQKQGGDRVRRFKPAASIVTLATAMVVAGVAFGSLHYFHKSGHSTASLKIKSTNAVSRPVAQQLAALGITVTPASPDANFISKTAAFASASPFLNHFKGVSTSTELVSVSKRDGNSYVKVSPSMSKGDPHFTQQHNLWRNISCYLIIISGVKNGMTSQGPPPNPPIQAKSSDNREEPSWSPPKSNAQPGGYVRDYALVDATNGTLLMTFQVQSYSPNS